MRSNRDKRSDNEREIDEFLAQFEKPLDELDTDVNSYLEDSDNKKTGDFTWATDSFFEKNDVEPVSEEEINRNEEPEYKRIYSTLYNVATSIPDEEEIIVDRETIRNNVKNRIDSLKKTNWKEFLFLDEQGKVSFKKIVKDCIAFGCALFVCFMLYSLVCVTFAPRVDCNDVYSYVDQSSIILDDEGKQVDSVFYTQNRKILKYDQLPENLINSFVALEDKTFWKHHGFNWIRMAGAVISSVTGGGQISGTSTITQQLARNVYLSEIKSVRSIRRKILEMYYASRIEANMSKKEIVEAYLNTIYLGYGCYGVDAAAHAYFSKDVKDLDLIECASLAALPQAPDSYALVQNVDSTSVNEGDKNIICREPDTYIANDLAKGRRQICLQFMNQQGYISDAQYKKNVDVDLIDFINPVISKGNGDNSYFHEYLVDTIIADLEDQYGMSYEDAERLLYTKGLRVYSTMDRTAQKVVTKEFNDSSNYPGISGIYDQDVDGNIVNKGQILLYKFENFFDDNGNFELTSDEGKVNSDGSVTIKHGGRLNIYTTTVDGETDYSLEFKQTYTMEDGLLYAIPGGYINVPANYKSLDANDNLVIAKEYFTDNPGCIKLKGNKIIVTDNAYSLPQKTVQPQSAMVIVGVGTGEVKAMVGGRTTQGERLLNRALNARQPGSSIKPIAVYGAALQKSYELEKIGKEWDYTDFKIDKQGTKGYGAYITTHSSVADERTTINGKTWPYNSNNSFTGSNTFMTAIQQSINTCAVKIQLQVGTDFSAKMIEKFNISTLVTDTKEEANDMNPSALALGGMTHGVIPLEMALAYSAFPAAGKVNTPICYTKVVDKDGEVILQGKSEQSEAMNEGVAWIMRNVLQTVVSRGIAGPASVKNIQSGGKTGTTNDQYDIWFDGFTPTYAAALWIGTDNNIKMSTMSGPAAALWGKIMNQIPKACTGVYLDKPANVIESGGYFYTLGTNKKLSKYDAKSEEEKEKEARQKAYQAWLKEREKHKIYVVDEKGHYEYYPKYDASGNPTGEKEERWIEEKWHYEYEKGWRDGDFKFKY